MIALFDSGVGGLSILREIQKLWPSADYVYLGDTAYVPYSGRSAEEIKVRSRAAVKKLLDYDPAVIVVACNTATSIAIDNLRNAFPGTPIIGVVPVVKTLAERTKNGRAAVIATEATLASATYGVLKRKFAAHLKILELAMPDWVRIVEAADFSSTSTKQSVAEVARQINAFRADTVALGSTHFPWLRPLLETQLLPYITLLDSGPAVARQTIRVLTENGKAALADGKGSARYLVSGDPLAFAKVASQLLHSEVQAEQWVEE